jgi:hypothetical protein
MKLEETKLEKLCRILDEVIQKVPGKREWVLKSKKTGRVLGRHTSKEKARSQERAIQASIHR